MICWDCFVTFLDRWQTLLTGLLAVAAAILALRPVYKQLDLMRTQNQIMVRSTIGEMIQQLDIHRDRVREIIGEGLRDICSSLHRFNIFGKPNAIGEWASEHMSEMRDVHLELRKLFSQTHDVEDIEARKAELLSAIDTVNNVLWDIFAPEWEFRHPEDCNWTDEERAAAVSRSSEAEDEIEEKAELATKAMYDLIAAYSAQREALLRQVRTIDDALAP